MRHILCTLVLAFPFGVLFAQPSAESTQQQEYQRQLDRYYGDLRGMAERQLRSAYDNLSLESRARLNPDRVLIEVSAGDDPICFQEGHFVVATSQKWPDNGGRILLCEPDIAHLTDAILGWQIVFMSASEDIAGLLLTSEDLNKPIPPEIDRRMKARVQRLLDYQITSNRNQKVRLSKYGQNVRTTCFAWQALYLEKQASGPIQCARFPTSSQQNVAAAEDTVVHFVSGMQLMAKLLDPTAPQLPPPRISANEALAATTKLRSTVLQLVTNYAVAHEVGHLVSSDPTARTKEAELDADAVPLKILGKTVEESSVLVFAALALEVIWEQAGDHRHYYRADSLHNAVYCSSKSPLASKLLRPNFAESLSRMTKEAGCKK